MSRRQTAVVVPSRLPSNLSAVSAALLLGLGGGQALSQSALPDVQAAPPVGVAQTAITALANLAAHAGTNAELVQAAISAITNIALRSLDLPVQARMPAEPPLPLAAPMAPAVPVAPVAPVVQQTRPQPLPLQQAPQPVVPARTPPLPQPQPQSWQAPQPSPAAVPTSPVPLSSAPLLPAPVLAEAPVSTSQSASLAMHGEIERGERHLEQQAPLTSGAEAPAERSAFFTQPVAEISVPEPVAAVLEENVVAESAVEAVVAEDASTVSEAVNVSNAGQTTGVTDIEMAEAILPADEVIEFAAQEVPVPVEAVAELAELAEIEAPEFSEPQLEVESEPALADVSQMPESLPLWTETPEPAAPINLTAFAASLTESVMREAHAQAALIPELTLPPLTVDVGPQASIAALQAEEPLPAALPREESDGESASSESGTPAEQSRPTLFVAAVDSTSAARPMRLPAPVPSQPPVTPVVPPGRAQPVATAKAEDDVDTDTDSRNDRRDDVNSDDVNSDDANSARRAVPIAPTAPVATATVATATVAAAEPTIAATTPAPTASAPAAKSTGKYTFNRDLLLFPVDLSMFADGNPVLPGVYRVEVYLNDGWVGKLDVRFANLKPNDRVAQPCFDTDLLEMLGFDPEHYVPEMSARLQAGEAICGPLSQIVEGAGFKFNFGEQKLMITAPQAVLKRLPRGYVDPKHWDSGITAATLHYSYNAYSSKQGGGFGGGTQTSHYLGLRSSLSLGDWRLRFRSSLNKSANSKMTHRRDSVYVERGVPSLQSRLIVGESPTSGHVFDSVSMLGAQLVSDTRMRPDSQNHFVPVIRGIAQSNAKVTVYQRGDQIYEMTVPPGPFVIDDLYPNGTGGDMDVVVTEADGTERTFTVAYANLPEMLRPGTMHYSANVGRYRSSEFEEEPVLGMLTGSYGFNNTITAYGGVMLAAGYHSATAGAGFNLPGVGAVSADATWANTRAAGGFSSHGYAFRLGWTKFMPKLDTDVSLAMYRYATQGFYEPQRAFQLRDSVAKGSNTLGFRSSQQRNQLLLRVSHQPKGKWGALSVGASIQDYWQREGRDLQYHAGWGRSFGNVSLGLTVNRSRNTGANRWENQYMLTLSLPLGASTRNPLYLNSSVNKQRDGLNGQVNVSGTLGERHAVGYSLFASGDKYKNQSLHHNGGGSISGITPINRMGASASASKGGSRQFSFSSSGAMVAYKGGVILASDLGETIGVVQAKDAAGAMVSIGQNVKLNSRGQAVVPWLQPYQENNISLDPKGLSKDVELRNTNQKVAPTDGAVVLLNYETRQGYAMLISGTRADGTSLPFAAGVLNEEGRNVGYVAQGGQALIRADAPKGAMTVRWGPQQDQRCTFSYDLSGVNQKPDDTGFRRVEVVCR